MAIYQQPSNRALPASGRSMANPGRIAGGAPGVTNPALVSVYPQTNTPAVAGSRPGGLIDKKQQADPSITQYAHPFDGGNSGYKSISTQQRLPAFSMWNGFVYRTDAQPELQPHEHGTFFQKKIIPAVKTVGGTRQTGPKSDTAFHPKKQQVKARPSVKGTIPTEKISRSVRPPSFVTSNTLRFDPNNSRSGEGRWSTVKQSANESWGPL